MPRDLNEIEPNRDRRIGAVLEDAMADLVSWRLASHSAPDEDQEVRVTAADLYDGLARLCFEDLQRAVVLVLMDTQEYDRRVDEGLAALHELAKTAGVPKGWRL